MKIIKSLILSLKNKKPVVIYSHSDLVLKKGASVKVKNRLQVGKKWHSCEKAYTSCVVGENAKLLTDRLSIYSGCKITVKKNAILDIKSGYMNSGCQINVKKKVTIGENCAIGNGVVIRDNNAHSINGKSDCEEITIGNHCWIGTNAIILPGASLGDGCVVAAGSVVTKKFPDGVLVGGVPAKIIKENITWGESAD